MPARFVCPKFNDRYFEVIDSEAKAYWLGFLYADGCVYRCVSETRIGGKLIKRSETDKLTLSIVDYEHLEKFKVALQAEQNIYTRTDTRTDCVYSYIVFHSIKLCNDLEQLGCVQKKSLILKFPSDDQVPSHLRRHFIRGYFDGDGCISFQKRRYPSGFYKYIRISFLGTYEFISRLKEILQVHHSIGKPSKIYSLEITGSSAKAILQYMYDDCTVALDRKKVMTYANI
jgi:hypothetical protein